MNENEIRDKLAGLLSHSKSGRRIHTVLAEDHSEIVGTSRVYWLNRVDEVLEALFPYVRTVEELDDLPKEEVIISEQGEMWVSTKNCDGTNDWIMFDSMSERIESKDISLPARVMYFPGVADNG